MLYDSYHGEIDRPPNPIRQRTYVIVNRSIMWIILITINNADLVIVQPNPITKPSKATNVTSSNPIIQKKL